MTSLDELKKELLEIERKLIDPGVVSDYKKATEISKRHSEIQKLIEHGGEETDFPQ